MKHFFIYCILMVCGSVAGTAQTVQQLDVSRPHVVPVHNLPGFQGHDAAGDLLGVNSRNFERNGKPWFPLMGEFHYWRYPAEYWEEQLVKMKSSGLQIVSTYVYWGAHEKPKGVWHWNDRLNLRRFVELCAKQGLWVWLRPGPYINGDVRGRGFPDRIYSMAGKRSNKPEYLAEVATYFREVGRETKGLWFKDGGPIIGVQLENEYASGDRTHIARLKELSQRAGMAPVYWSVTANTVFQDNKFEVLPLQGAYCYRGWESGKSLTTDFLFAEDQWIMDANFGRVYYDVDKYPRGTCEQGAGMQETHAARFVVEPQVIEAHAANQLGRGINMLGYFMFQGGTQYPGTEMPPSDGRLMPSGLVSYDYQAPLDEFGRMADSYKYLKLLHLFLNDFGDRLVQMQVYRPKQLPKDPGDVSTLRYTGRFDATGKGFMFVCNTQNYRKMTDKTVQFKLQLPGGSLLFPQQPVTFKDERIAQWPVNFEFGGLNLLYATAQVLCKVTEPERSNLFLYETEGIPSELALNKKDIKQCTVTGFKKIDVQGRLILKRTSLPATAMIQTAKGKQVMLTVLSRKDAENSWKTTVDGREYIFITDAEMLFYPHRIVARQTSNPEFSMRVYPALPAGMVAAHPVLSGIFSEYHSRVATAEIPYKALALNDSVYMVQSLRKWSPALSDVMVDVRFKGDMGVAMLDGKRVADRLWYGKDWVLGLKRFSAALNKKDDGMRIEIKGNYMKQKPRIEAVTLLPEYELVWKK